MVKIDALEEQFPCKDGVYQINHYPVQFESCYLSVRHKEGRLYSDEVLKKLPNLPVAHPQAKEWAMRKSSAQKLYRYLNFKKGDKIILDLGCGNGWLVNYLAEIPHLQLVGLDINQTELMQGARLFKRPNVKFAYGYIEADDFNLQGFDQIILSSVIQYFPELPRLIRKLLGLLNSRGEIHILDSPWYTPRTVQKAQKRSADYFQRMGTPEMQPYYYHHVWNDLSSFNYRVMHSPASLPHYLQRKFFGLGSPFPWIIIDHPENHG